MLHSDHSRGPGSGPRTICGARRVSRRQQLLPQHRRHVLASSIAGPMIAPSSPTVRRRRLAAELDGWECKGKSGDAVAATLKWLPSKVSRYERAWTGLHPREVERLLDYHQITGPRRAFLLASGQLGKGLAGRQTRRSKIDRGTVLVRPPVAAPWPTGGGRNGRGRRGRRGGHRPGAARPAAASGSSAEIGGSSRSRRARRRPTRTCWVCSRSPAEFRTAALFLEAGTQVCPAGSGAGRTHRTPGHAPPTPRRGAYSPPAQHRSRTIRCHCPADGN